MKAVGQNCLNEIRNLIPLKHWIHCRNQDNPTNIPSRGNLPRELINRLGWTLGNKCHAQMIVYKDYSNLTQLLLGSVYILRFIHLLKTETNPLPFINSWHWKCYNNPCLYFTCLRSFARATPPILNSTKIISTVKGNQQKQDQHLSQHLNDQHKQQYPEQWSELEGGWVNFKKMTHDWLTNSWLIGGMTEIELITSYLLAVGQLSIMYMHAHMILDFNKRNLVWFSDDKGEWSSS